MTEFTQALIAISVGVAIGTTFGWIISRNNPKRSHLLIAYMSGRIDQIEGTRDNEP